MDGKIYKAISATMKDIGAVGKGDSNDFDHYKYRGIDAVMNALNPAMIKNGIFVVPTVLDSIREERQGKNGTLMMYSIIKVKYSFYADDGSCVECVVVGEAMDRSDKSTNKAMSAAFKYACFQTFCIPTEEMIDTESESPEMGAKTQKTVKKTDEQKNQEMINSVDPILLPGGDINAKKEKLMQELKRTGVAVKTVLDAYSVKSIDEMDDMKLTAALGRMAKTPDKGKK